MMVASELSLVELNVKVLEFRLGLCTTLAGRLLVVDLEIVMVDRHFCSWSDEQELSMELV